MIKKNVFLNVIILLISFYIVGCGKNHNGNDVNNDTVILKDDINVIVRFVKDLSYEKNYFKNYNTYYLENNHLSLIQYIDDNMNNEYDLSLDNFIGFGRIIKDENNNIYLSIENDKFCAFKDFSSENIEIYDIEEKRKCHKTYIYGDKLTLDIFSSNLGNDQIYNSGEVSNDFVSLIANSNVLDSYNCTYKWYRNGEEIKDSNVQTYVVANNSEDADYYVEMTTDEGEKVTSAPINVKINVQ